MTAWSRYHDNLWTHFRRTGESAANNPTLSGDGAKALELGIIAAGSAHEVAAQLAQEIEASGIRYMIGAFCWGDIDHAEAIESLNRFASEVMPRVEREAC